MVLVAVYPRMFLAAVVPPRILQVDSAACAHASRDATLNQMQSRVEVLKGRGRLVSRVSQIEREVAYRFDITFRMVDQPGRPAIEKQFETRGSVKDVDGATLPNGHYDLHPYDLSVGEPVYHVWRDEERWHIEA